MIITPIQTYLTPAEYIPIFNEDIATSYPEPLMLLQLWEASCILLQTKQHATFDPTTERGRYITQALQTHQVLLHTQLQHAQTSSSKEGILSADILVRLFECEYWSSLGVNSKAVQCFDANEAQIRSYWRLIAKDNLSDMHQICSHCSASDDGLFSLHLLVATSNDTLELPLSHNALIYLNNVREKQLARHLLLHSLAPTRALAVLRRLQPNAQTIAWELLAQCLLGACDVTQIKEHIEWDALTSEWDAVLGELGRRSDYSLVHSLFSQVVYVLRSQRDSGKERRRLAGMDQSRTIVAGLLSVGAVEVAAQHLECVLRGNLLSADSKERSSSTEELQRVLLASPALQLLLPLQFPYDELLSSGNVRAALALHCLLQCIQSNGAAWSIFLRNGDMLSLYLSTVFQATAPVTLIESGQSTGTAGGWMREAAVLRYIMVDTLSALVSACEGGAAAANNACALSDPVSNVGARGLFLLAYQGASLLQEGLAALSQAVGADCVESGSGDDCTTEIDALSALRTLLRDNTVPVLYERLLECTAADTNTILHQSAGAWEGSESTVPVAAEAVLPSRRVRVAFLSFFFRRHPVGRLLARVITGLDSNLFDVHIIAKQEHGDVRQDDSAEGDAITSYLRQHIDSTRWLLIPHNEVTAVNLIRKASFDVVVFGDVFMDAFVAHLASTRVAPAQVLFWGHPFTSGFHSMDYFISSDLFEPPNSFTR